MKYRFSRRSFVKASALLLTLSLLNGMAFTIRATNAQSAGRPQRTKGPVEARLILRANYKEAYQYSRSAADTTESTNDTLTWSLSLSRGLKLDPQLNGSVDILDLPNSPTSVDGGITYSEDVKHAKSGEGSSQQTAEFSGTFQSVDDAYASAEFMPDAPGLTIHLQLHPKLIGHASQHEVIEDHSGSRVVTRTSNQDECTALGDRAALLSVTGENPSSDRTSDTKCVATLTLKEDIRPNFDAGMAAAQPGVSEAEVKAARELAAATAAGLPWDDSPFTGAVTKGDAGAGYKVTLDKTVKLKPRQTNDGSTESGLISFNLTAQIVPGGPARSALGPADRLNQGVVVAREAGPLVLPRRFQI